MTKALNSDSISIGEIMRVIIRDHYISAGYGIWFMKDVGQNQVQVCKPLKLEFNEPHEDCFALPEPTIQIPFRDAQPFLQSMINALVEMGVRSNNDRTAGELEATKKHLQDLQNHISGLMNLLNNKVK